MKETTFIRRSPKDRGKPLSPAEKQAIEDFRAFLRSPAAQSRKLPSPTPLREEKSYLIGNSLARIVVFPYEGSFKVMISSPPLHPITLPQSFTSPQEAWDHVRTHYGDPANEG